MLRFLTFRISLMLITLLVVSMAIFSITEVLPGDVTHMILKATWTEERAAVVRADLDLDRPAYERYLSWVGNAVRGDLGVSYFNKQPITDVLPRRIWHSLILAVFALLVGIPFAVIAGIWAGIHPDGILDRLVSTISLVGISLPEFVTGVVLMLILASTLDLLPPTSNMLRGESPFTRPQILVLPTLTLTGVLFAYIMRMTRASVIEVMQSHYIRTAILKGMPMRRVILRHVLPNSMLPTITIIAQNFGYMLGGLIIVEEVFSYPGIGKELLDAMVHRDLPMLEAVSLIVAGTYALSNLAADLSYGVLDPRIRLS